MARAEIEAGCHRDDRLCPTTAAGSAGRHSAPGAFGRACAAVAVGPGRAVEHGGAFACGRAGGQAAESCRPCSGTCTWTRGGDRRNPAGSHRDHHCGRNGRGCRACGVGGSWSGRHAYALSAPQAGAYWRIRRWRRGCSARRPGQSWGLFWRCRTHQCWRAGLACGRLRRTPAGLSHPVGPRRSSGAPARALVTRGGAGWGGPAGLAWYAGDQGRQPGLR